MTSGDQNGDSALKEAVNQGHIEMVVALQYHGADSSIFSKVTRHLVLFQLRHCVVCRLVSLLLIQQWKSLLYVY